MRTSQLFNLTLREAPLEARTPGLQFLTRAGYVRLLGAAGCAFLPLGMTARRTIQALVAAPLSALGAQPIALPQAQGAELAAASTESLAPLQFRDRGQRQMALPATQTPAALALIAGVLQSYRQLPALLYTVWPAYDGAARGGGPLTTADGLTLEAYHLHPADEGETRATALSALLTQVGDLCAPVVQVATTRGVRGVFPWPDGESTSAHCPACGLRAAPEAINFRPPPAEASQPAVAVETPECKTIAALADFLKVSPARTAKAVFLTAQRADGPAQFIFGVVRGDTALDEHKLKRLLGAQALLPATEAEIRAAGAEPGYGSPVGLSGVTVIVDRLAAASPNLVAGANRPGYHLLNVNVGRDFAATQIADIAQAQEGSPCPQCGSALTLETGYTLWDWEALEPAAIAAAGVTCLDPGGKALTPQITRYRVRLDRLLGALAETHHDAQGLLWPAAAAPFQVHLLTLGKADAAVTTLADRIYTELQAAGVTVLFDDRDERPGVKFADADLIGAPLRIGIGARGVAAGAVEIKRRGSPDTANVPVDEVVAWVRNAERWSI